MNKNYTPVTSVTFVNITKAMFANVRLNTHNAPAVRTRIGRVGRKGVETFRPFDSREEAREQFEDFVSKLTEKGYVQVA